jgi:Tat protein translocase TatB subunit
MPTLGPAEIIVILVVALIVFGPQRLPEIGRQVGGVLRELRKIQQGVKDELDAALTVEAPTPEAAPQLQPIDPPEPERGDPDAPRGAHRDGPGGSPSMPDDSGSFS